MSILEIILLLIVALIVIPPDRLPEVMRAVGKILREVRLASNTMLRELSGAIEDTSYRNDGAHNNPATAPWSKAVNGSPADNEPSAGELPPQI